MRKVRKKIKSIIAVMMAAVTVAAGCLSMPETADASNAIAKSKGANTSSLNACNAALNMLPSWLVSRYTESGWSVVVTSADINSTYFGGSGSSGINAAIVSDQSLIVVANQSSANAAKVKKAMLHEMGHWVDSMTSGSGYTFASQRSDFTAIYKKEYSTYKATFGMDDSNMAQSVEFFASAFYRYFVSGSTLKAKCPNLYAYVEGKLNALYYAPVFDAQYYLSKYSDLKKAYGSDTTAAISHFIRYGMREGRQAKSSFNVQSYRYKYQDLRLAFGTNLKSYYEHYVVYGRKEGRKATGVTSLQNPVTAMDGVNYSAVYDYSYYFSKYADLRKAYGDDDVALLKHFIRYGMREGRQAKSTFNVQTYRARYADLRKAFGSNLKSYYLHFIRYGKSEGRTAV